jgi:hypothetical protein
VKFLRRQGAMLQEECTQLTAWSESIVDDLLSQLSRNYPPHIGLGRGSELEKREEQEEQEERNAEDRESWNRTNDCEVLESQRGREKTIRYVFSDLGKENDMLDEPDALRNVVTKSDIYSFPPV